MLNAIDFCPVVNSVLLLRESNHPASYKKSRATMKILIADSMHNSLFAMLENENWTYSYNPDFKRADIAETIGEFDGLIIRSKTFLDKEILDQAGKLKFIARAGAGLDLIDLKVANEKGIAVFHAGEGNRDAVAEHAVGMLLCLFNNILRADKQVRSGIWDREGNRGVEVMNKTIGIIGYGNNGSATAKRLSGFGCRVLAYDKYLKNYGDAYAEESSLERIMEEADVLSLHIPLTEETRYLVADQFVQQFSKPFYLLNLSRGEIVKLDSVVGSLKSGKILGACLDVLENEKIRSLTPSQQSTFDYLIASDKVIFTPHIGGWTHESYRRINEVLVKQIGSLKSRN
jgi:D-3-phosphoglycerate dehydrogenase / 2-oxoglutarate reductase